MAINRKSSRQLRIAEGENVNPILALIGNYSDPHAVVVVVTMANDSTKYLKNSI